MEYRSSFGSFHAITDLHRGDEFAARAVAHACAAYSRRELQTRSCLTVAGAANPRFMMWRCRTAIVKSALCTVAEDDKFL